jgi:hypothetical protein
VQFAPGAPKDFGKGGLRRPNKSLTFSQRVPKQA